MDHQRRPQANRYHVHDARPGDAGARLRRRDHDALAAGIGVSCARLPAARALQSDLFGARHRHDLLRCHAADDRPDELRGAVAARGARRRLPDLELDKLLANSDRRAAGQSLAGDRRVRTDWLAALSALVGDHLYAWRWGRLLLMGA